ncbi:MAG: VWA domain-containing protein, partial [Pseudomonadota bacterium]
VPSVDIPASLNAGKQVSDPGLLSVSSATTLIIANAERLPTLSASIIAAHLDDRPARITAVLCDESDGDDEELVPSLRERASVTVDLRFVPWNAIGEYEEQKTPRNKHELSHDVFVPDAAAKLTAEISLTLGHETLRPTLNACALAKASAVLDGRKEVDADDIAEAIEIALGIDLTRQQPEAQPEQQAAPEPQSAEPSDNRPEPPRDQNDHDGSEAETPGINFEALQEMLVEASQSGQIKIDQRTPKGTSASNRAIDGKAGAMRKGAKRGRPAGLVSRPPYHGARLNVPATLRTAAPWQKLRRFQRADIGLPTTDRPIVRAADFRYIRYQQPTESIAIFAVDASGSTALDRLAEAKGAVEQLLAQCYVRRDSVAMITFRGQASEIVLEPTRSLVRAKRTLSEMVGGGGTPLAAGLRAGLDLAIQSRSRGKSPLLVMLTDGRGNIALDGTADRKSAANDTAKLARMTAANSVPSVFIDIARRPRDTARDLANIMNADYCALPRLDAGAISTVVGSYFNQGARR